MDDIGASVLRVLGVQGALVAAVIHLFEGVPDLLVYLPLLSVRDPRPYLFVPSALLLVALATLIVRGRRHRRLYSLSAGVLLAYAAGYAWWHLTDHGGLVPEHTVANPVGEVAAHLATDPVALVAFAAELVGAACFLALFVADPELRGNGAVDPADPDDSDGPGRQGAAPATDADAAAPGTAGDRAGSDE